MADRLIPSPLFRCVAAMLIATLAIGAAWAPPGGTLQCDACRRDLIGNVICTKLAATTQAPVHACCKKTAPVGETKPATKPQQGHGDPCPAKCAPCCVPQAHAPAVPPAFVAVHVPGDVVIELKPTSVSTPSFGVHYSIFHPPRA